MTTLAKILKRKSASPASHYGKDASRNLVIALIPGSMGRDMIQLTPAGTRRHRTILVTDLWSHMQRCEANKAWSLKMAEKKARKQAATAVREQRKATAKLAREVKKAQA